MKIITVAGTRPEIIKLSTIIPLLNDNFDHQFIYTGQHFSNSMKDIVVDDLNLNPDYDLKSDTSNIDTITKNMTPILKRIDADYVIIYGDTNSSMAAALAAEESHTKIIHIEAGVRDFDITVPEEPLRIRIDEMAEVLYSPSDFCTAVLSYENIHGNVITSGNLVVDVCKKLSKIASETIPKHLPNEEFLMLTLHRPENVDDPTNLNYLMNHFSNVDKKILFPVHPRTRKNLKNFSINVPPNLILIEPLGYIQFLSLFLKSKLVLTDSGGIQEEAVVLKKPCITLRHTSARWETILLKANILFPPTRKDNLNDVVNNMIDTKITRNPYGEDVALKIINHIKDVLV